MFKTVLSDQRLREAEFICNRDSTRIFIGADELRRVLPLGTLDDRGKWTFTINAMESKIEGQTVFMRMVKTSPVISQS
jgi:hypothetical protein